MNRRQLTILIALVVVIGGLGLFLYHRNTASWTSSGMGSGQKLMGTFDVNGVGQIKIRQGTNELNLFKKNELWVVKERNDYPANFSDISEFVRKVAELKAVEMVQVGSSQRPRLELTEPGGGTNSGTMVEFKSEPGSPLKSFLLGKKHLRKTGQMSPFGDDGGFPDGRYVLMNGAKDVAVISDPLSNAEPKPEQWLDKDFFKIEKVRGISLVSTNATNSWKLTRESETNDWKLVDARAGEQLDVNKVSSVANAFSHPSFVDVVPNPKPEQTGLDRPTALTFDTFDGLSYAINIGSKTNEDNFFLALNVSGGPAKQRVAGKDEKPEEKEKLDKEFKEKSKQFDEKLKTEKKFENWTYLVAKWTVDAALKDRGQLLAEKPATNQTATATNAAPSNLLKPSANAPGVKPADGPTPGATKPPSVPAPSERKSTEEKQ